MTKSHHTQVRVAPKARRTHRDGTVFHSRGELKRWKDLQLWQLTGEIRNLRRQVAYELVVPGGRPVLTPKGHTATYKADFVYERLNNLTQGGGWITVVEDHKGYYSRENQFKIAVFEALTGKKVTLSGAYKRAK